MLVVSFSTDCEARRRVARAAFVSGLPAGLFLLWPALLNRYPLVFSDTGTYLSQMVERHLGWDRPVFYSLLVLPLHLTLTTWPVIVAQAGLTLYAMRLAMRLFAGDARWLTAILAVLAVATPLPWVTAQLIPDFATALLTLLLPVLAVPSERLAWREHWLVALLVTGLITLHQSNVLLAPLLLLVLLPLRRRLGAVAPLGWRGLLLAGGPLVAATLGLTAVNAIGHDRFSPSPYGNVFALARSLADGPAMDALRRHCPQSGWRLCFLVREGQPRSADEFLWPADSALARAGGAKRVATEADAILLTALREEPGAVVRGALRNTARQLGMVATGDGLQPWPGTVTPVIHRDFPPAESRRYDDALQTQGRLSVPRGLQALHAAALVLGVAATLVWLAVALRRRHAVSALCVAVLVCLLGNAAITGALSGPHDRYESRVVWLPVFVPFVAGLALRRRMALSRVSPSPDRVPADVAAPSAWSA